MTLRVMFAHHQDGGCPSQVRSRGTCDPTVAIVDAINCVPPAAGMAALHKVATVRRRFDGCDERLPNRVHRDGGRQAEGGVGAEGKPLDGSGDTGRAERGGDAGGAVGGGAGGWRLAGDCSPHHRRRQDGGWPSQGRSRGTRDPTDMDARECVPPIRAIMV